MLEVERVPMLKDNYAWLLVDPATGATAIVDPAESRPVLDRLKASGQKLDRILATHHHADHIAGIPDLVAATGAKVMGPAADAGRIPGLDVQLREGDTVSVGSREARVIETPGHTSGHISFWFEADRQLFCADTLFALGCGRLLEGDAPTMWRSLQKLLALPDDTAVCCGHEYTQANARFALTVDPTNQALQARAREVEAKRSRNEPTVPSTLAEERRTNPFLRPSDPAIRKQLGLEQATDTEVFAEIRRRKDRF
jgi:hydroxyacylglutathione hydrolase